LSATRVQGVQIVAMSTRVAFFRTGSPAGYGRVVVRIWDAHAFGAQLVDHPVDESSPSDKTAPVMATARL